MLFHLQRLPGRHPAAAEEHSQPTGGGHYQDHQEVGQRQPYPSVTVAPTTPILSTV